MSDHIYLHGLSHLCAATGGGCNWLGDRSSTMRPSTGFLAVVLALQICRKVRVRGRGTARVRVRVGMVRLS